jgi:hypothetical protein
MSLSGSLAKRLRIRRINLGNHVVKQVSIRSGAVSLKKQSESFLGIGCVLAS